MFLFRAIAFAERLQLNIAVLHGEHNQEDSEICDGRHSPPPARRSNRQRGYSECTNNEMLVSLGEWDIGWADYPSNHFTYNPYSFNDYIPLHSNTSLPRPYYSSLFKQNNFFHILYHHFKLSFKTINKKPSQTVLKELKMSKQGKVLRKLSKYCWTKHKNFWVKVGI